MFLSRCFQAIYQYRCNECQYATKYCHSLKLHLRKYGHTPAMVLNPDGTPNPLPIIDVYGTRRGPKIKRDDSNAFPVLPPHILQQIQKTNLQNPHRQIPPQQVLDSLRFRNKQHARRKTFFCRTFVAIDVG